jgi:hypothetical protein
MALMTRSKFYYGVNIETDNNLFDFDDGGGEISITIPVGYYSPTEIAQKIASLMSEGGGQSYVGSFDRTTRLITITGTANFSILIATGTNNSSTIYENLGYTQGVDLTGSNSYVGQDFLGLEFKPQFYLLDYVPLEHNVKSVQASINETANGNIEIIKYGKKRLMECSIDFITDQRFLSEDTSVWQSDTSGVSNALSFLNVVTEKSVIEFMPDLNDATFYFLILESTEEAQDGTAFKLKEMEQYGSGIFRTGKLVFREIT